MVVSLVSATPIFVNPNPKGVAFLKEIHAVQRHYGLVSVDLSTMARLLEKNSSIDLLWPQSPHLISQNGTKVTDDMERYAFRTLYWANFLPKTQVARNSRQPSIHAPWPTHQYVADTVMYSILSAIDYGLKSNNEENEQRFHGILLQIPWQRKSSSIHVSSAPLPLYSMM
jgi:hypothetical protein